METSATETSSTQPPWRSLTSEQRRVIGVLVEKAKTTPDAYPMTLNALANGCNQKSNRAPQMNIATDDAELTLDELREMGAVAEVVGSGRVAKYRHLLYDWLGVDKTEIAVMAELLLRGEQTVGELRGRAARMEPIADLAALRPLLKSLIDKGLVISLTPEGRGQTVTHALYPERELNEIRSRAASQPAPPRSAPAATTSPAPVAVATSPAVTPDMLAEITVEVAELRAVVGQLRQRVQDLEEKLA